MINIGMLAELSSALDPLARQGFSLEELRYVPRSFGNILIAARRGTLLVRVVKDRGEWTVEFATEHPTPVWRFDFDLLGDPRLEAAMSTLDELSGRVRMLASSLDRIEHVLTTKA